MIVPVTNGLRWQIPNNADRLTALAHQRTVRVGVPQGGLLGPSTPLVQAKFVQFPTTVYFSRPLQVFVLLAQDGHLVLEEHGVQAKLGVDQRHVAKPVGEGVDALLPLVEVLRVGPWDTLGTLWDGEKRSAVEIQRDEGEVRRTSGGWRLPADWAAPCTASSGRL